MADEVVLLLCMLCVSAFSTFGCRCDVAKENPMAKVDCRELEAASTLCTLCASGLGTHPSDVDVVTEEDSRKLVVLPVQLFCASRSNFGPEVGKVAEAC